MAMARRNDRELPPLEAPGDTSGTRIRWCREAAQLARADLARLANLTLSGVAGIESDRRGRRPRIVNATAIAEVLGVDPVWLREGVGEAPARAAIYAFTKGARRMAENERAARARWHVRAS